MGSVMQPICIVHCESGGDGDREVGMRWRVF